MATTSQLRRAFSGPALLAQGHRPFFLFGSLWAAAAMTLWIAMLGGAVALPTVFDPVSWHAHAFLFGYLGAVTAGFLLTAVPNWTGRLPLMGWPLLALVLVWAAGRVAVSVSALLPFGLAAAVDLAFPLALAGVTLREIVAGRNWRNLSVWALLVMMTLGQGLFHLDALRGDYAAGGLGLRVALAAAIGMILLIGGRVVPSFTRNWLAQRRETRLPAPLGRFDGIALATAGLALMVWTVAPAHWLAALLCLLAGVLHLIRLGRWVGHRTLAEPLVWVLHLSYALVPVGFLAVGLASVLPGLGAVTAAQHVWMAGAVGMMTLAIMTRASLGHSGRPLTASPAVAALYLVLLVAVMARFAEGLGAPGWLLHLAGAGWIAAFLGFALLYWPILTRPRAMAPA
ncbi:NnrS family protein [Rhodovulum sp.]|uniref:NnrS family protein n=1 Tax=Rhodovulum sp. TaxID=34009 RepID=UPI001839354C|nr:NnrS family protein [Rhodovulum sp.]HDR28080.1 NnrS family protein [Rhodovulum sp.]